MTWVCKNRGKNREPGCTFKAVAVKDKHRDPAADTGWFLESQEDHTQQCGLVKGVYGIIPNVHVEANAPNANDEGHVDAEDEGPVDPQTVARLARK